MGADTNMLTCERCGLTDATVTKTRVCVGYDSSGNTFYEDYPLHPQTTDGDDEVDACVDAHRLALAAVTTERDRLHAENDRLVAEVARLSGAALPRRLREYKGVTYRDGYWRHSDGSSYAKAADVISVRWNEFTDADHAELLALRDDPWEPVDTLEEVIRRASVEGPFGTKIYSHVANAVRAWLSQQTPTLTVHECVARLVELGAKRRKVYANSLTDDYTMVDALILPPEVSL